MKCVRRENFYQEQEVTLQADKHSLVFNSWHTGVGFSLARWVLTVEVALLIPLRGTAGSGWRQRRTGGVCMLSSVVLSDQ